MKYITLFSKSFVNNKIQIQNIDSNACGYYCIYFILLKARGFNLKNINELFSKSNFRINDFLVSHIID